jgi:hypothetical protein
LTLQDSLLQHGLHVRGVARLNDEEIERYSLDAEMSELALIGNIGSSYWAEFSQSVEFNDAQADPLDRWSRRVAEPVAQAFSMRPIYPFEGPPYYPFQQWADRAEGLAQSPVGVMIHPQFGLWHSYRFALLGTGFDHTPLSVAAKSPCLSCETRPCLNTCPVDPFDANGYDVASCARYLQATPQAQCHQQGCLARNACPVGPEFRYLAEQGRFHLGAFLQSQ